ncbi:MAG: HlyD family type I secretion periplasmic adaptor subunit [Verrucomicrobiae bacterium]|nr:HlyD family type I secretion periplasmic adaptor subunit [Verrucomicrobiae bacterium]MCP5541278.1 HlyD family type I secretion periplasmic adaptor subunit [Akkermansiaceae bacterium]MCP5550943.1 HlyD family type I secretion periplasmic adaptor subunit [Akkermansiaceae bacterium]
MNASASSRYLDYTGNARAAIAGERVNGANWLLFSIVALLASGFGWASMADLDEVTKGNGKVIPSSSIQTIQNLEGGILAEMAVREGDRVEKGQVLARIDDTMSAASYRENLSQRDALEAMVSRLFAEANGQDAIDFSPKIRESRPDLVEAETSLFDKRLAELTQRVEVIGGSLKLASQELEMTRPMVEKRAVSKVEQLRLEREVNELEGKLRDTRGEFQRAAMELYNETKARLEGLDESLRAREDRVSRAVVRSPVNGTVNKIHIRNVGGVIQPGESIMDIVPVDDTLLVQANIRPSDIAFLRPGQEAVVKFTAYDFAIYGGLKGTVEHISADTIEDEVDRERYYQIKVRNTQGKLVKNGEELPIIPGMVAEVDVLTGRRTVLQYLLKPLYRARVNSLTER